MSDNLETTYGLYRQTAAGDDAAAVLRERYGGGEAAPAKKEGDAPPPPEESTIGEKASAVAKDVGMGAVETPRAVLKGVRDAAQETVNTVGELGDWLESKFPLADYTPDFLAIKPPVLPDLNAPTSTTGGLVKGVSQFLTGFLGAGKLRALKAWKPASGAAKVAKGAVQGGVADFTVFDPHDERLSNLIQDFPQLANPVTEYLEAEPGDSAAEGRFKNTVEGLGLGGLTEGFLIAVRALRAARIARTPVVEALTTVVEGTKPGPLDALGDPKGDLFIAKDEAGNKLDTAGKAVSDVTPGQVLGKEPTLGEVGDVTGPGAIEHKVDVNAAEVGTDPALGKPGEVTGPGATEHKVGDAAVADTDPKVTGDKPRIKGPAAKIAPASIEINFARINSPQDVKEVMQRMTDMAAKDINNERRGVRSWEQTKLSADQKDAWDILQKRRMGEPLNAEESLAARRLWVASASKLTELAQLATGAPTPENLFAFRKQLATHYAVQKEVIAARTETARALNAWAITADGDGLAAKQIANLLENAGGEDTAKELAKRISSLSKAGMAKELEEVVEKGALARTRDGVRQVWVNALLTNPATHVGNVASNFLIMGQALYERKAAAMLGQMLGDQSGAVTGETLAMMHGTVMGVRDALRLAAKRLRLGDGIEMPAGMERNKVEGAGGAWSAEAWNVASDTPMGKFLDLADIASRAPGSAMGFSDDMFKMIGYRMELHALAHRRAVQDAAAGKIEPDMLRNRTREILENPPEDLKLDAVDAALYRTFNSEPAKAADRIASAWQDLPVFGVLTLPFKNTPINVMTYAFERTPLAPLVGKWREDIAAGGARQQAAMAKYATGNMILLAAMDLAMQGEITGGGPQAPGEKSLFQREGKQRYSVKLGDQWVSYNRLDPAGTLLGLGADMVEIARAGGSDSEEFEQFFTASALALGNAITSKTYMSGIADLFEAMGDKERYGEGYAKKLIAGMAVPPGVAAARRIDDPYLRFAQDIGDSIRNRTPGLSESLPLMRDLWGREVSFRSGMGTVYDLFSPAYVKRENPEPIDKELERLEFYPTLPGKQFTERGVTIDLSRYPEAYSRYIELAGNAAKHPAYGMGAKDFLNQVVTGQSALSTVYQMRSDGAEGGKANYIAQVMSQYRRLARRQLLEEFPDLAMEVEMNAKPGRGMLAPELVQ